MKRATKPRAIVFDLDGTLIDSLALVLRSIAHALEPYGPKKTTEEIFAKLGGPPERFLATLLDDARHVPAALQRMDAYHRANWHTIRPFADVADLLARLRAGGVKLAVWTGRDRESGTWLLRELRLENLFDTVVFGDDLPTHKPDPEGLREIMRRLGVTPAETLFVGDADVDVLGGVAGGVDTVLIHHARAIEAAVRSKSWQNVATPRDAFELLLRSLE
jgi:phosphoglycolate phosphatase/pyrophosphatase PpaX